MASEEASFVHARFHANASAEWSRRPTTDLLAVPFSLTQTGVLSPTDFVKNAERRGWRVSLEALALLADLELLVPMFEMTDQPVEGLAIDSTAGFCEWPFEAHVQAREVSDPVSAPFDVRRLDRCRYTRWQLLWFESVVWNELQPKTEVAFRGFADDARVAPWFTEVSRANRAFALAVEAIAASYMPYISNHISSRGGDAWSPTLTLEASDLVAWLDVEADVLHRQAQLLLAGAKRVDPLADWSALTGHATWAARHKLKGAALVAVDLREAAELLLRVYEDLPDTQLSTATPGRIGGFWQPLHERLHRPADELDRLLNDLGLSPFPHLIVAVEGQTEEAIFPKALDVLGWQVGIDAIELVNLRGVGNDVSLLARYAGAPRLAEELQDSVLLRRPLAHIAVIADPEGPYETADKRAAVKERLVDELVLSLPERFRTSTMREDMANVVTVDTWGGLGGPFEFAHFTDEELADAIIELCPGIDRDSLIDGIAGQRRNGSPDIDKVLRSKLFAGQRHPKKVELALHLWRPLEAAVADAASTSQPSDVPLARICQDLLGHLNNVAFVKALRF